MRNVRLKGGIDPWIVVNEDGDHFQIGMSGVRIRLHKSFCVETSERPFTIKETSKVYALEALVKQLSLKVSEFLAEVSRLSNERSELKRQIANHKLEIATLELKKQNASLQQSSLDPETQAGT